MMEKNLTINDSLSLIERSVLCNIHLYENFEDKVIYFEKYYNNLIKQVFNNKNYIVETYRRKFTRNLIIESTFDFQNEIKKTHNFIKKAIKFDTLLEQAQPTTNTQQPNKTYSTKTASIESPGLINPETVNPSAKFKDPLVVLSQMSWPQFFSALRNALESGAYDVISTVLGLVSAGSNTAINILAWGSVVLYEAYEIFNNKVFSKIPQFLSDLISLVTEAISLPSIPGLDKLKNAKQFLKKIVGKGFEEILENIVKKLAEVGILAQFYTVLSGFNKVMGFLKQSATWIEMQFKNKYTFFSTAISSVIDFVQKFIDSSKKMLANKPSDLTNDVKQIGTTVYNTLNRVNTNNQKQNNIAGVNYKMDTGKI